MKKFLSLFLGLALLLMVGQKAQADSFGSVSMTAAANTLLFFSPNSTSLSTVPAIATAASVVQPGIDVRKIIITAVTPAVPITAQLWDSPDGTTTCAKCKFVTALFVPISQTTAVLNFSESNVDLSGDGVLGIPIVGYPAVVNSSNAAFITIKFKRMVKNKIQGVAGN